MNVSELFGVSGKIVLVTGGSSGIGYMIAEGFVANGAKVYISSRKADVCESVSKKLTEMGPGTCHSVPSDLSKVEGIKRLSDEMHRLEPNGIDILINNAGATWGEKFDDYPQSGFEKVMNLNLTHIFYLCQHLVRLLEKRGTREDPSRIINISSIAGLGTPSSENYAYSASKAGIIHLTKALTLVMAKRNITVNTIAPGPFQSKMMAETLKKGGDAYERAIPLGRIGNPRDMSAASIYLSSKGASFVTGSVLVVDGGILASPKI